ncbi:MAG: hypothetical protein RJA79_350 [Actinomycetota bacterium]
MRNSVLVFSLLGVSSCGADGSTDTSQTAVNETVTESEVAPENSASNSAVDTKAQFTATLLSGATFDSATVLEKQPLALWFWAPG